jgi:hypothetical protein
MFKRIVFTVLLMLPAAQVVIAHDTWIEKRDSCSCSGGTADRQKLMTRH